MNALNSITETVSFAIKYKTENTKAQCNFHTIIQELEVNTFL